MHGKDDHVAVQKRKEMREMDKKKCDQAKLECKTVPSLSKHALKSPEIQLYM